MKAVQRVLPSLVFAALLVTAGHAASLPSSCADASTSVESATSETTEYSFGAPGHVVAAEGVYWVGIPGEVLTLLGPETGCWTGGVVVGIYDDTSVYECDPLHCPIAGCPAPCFAYHSATCMAPESTGGQVIEGFECAQYGDGISREASSGDLEIRNTHLHDLNDDAVEDDYGLSDTRVFGSLIDGVHTAFGDRQRVTQNNDATGTEWEVRESLIRVRPNANPYKRRPGHGGFWKGDPNPAHQHRYRITNNVFVAQGKKQAGLLFPVVGYVDECAGNTLLWAGPTTGSGGWEEALADQNDLADGLSDGARLVALNAAFPDCFRVVLKPEAQPEAEFLASPQLELGGKSWNQLVAEWQSANQAPGLVITAPVQGTTVNAGAAVGFAASADDTEDGDLSAEIQWGSSLAGQLGSGASLTLTDLPVGAQRVTAWAIDSGGRVGNAAVTVTVQGTSPPPPSPPRTGWGCGLGPELALLVPVLWALRPLSERRRSAAGL